MNLQDFAKPIVAKNRFVKASFGGFAGAGKSRTASDFIIGCYKEMKIKAPMLFVDNEKGSRFLTPKFEAAGIKVLLKETVELADIQQAIQYLNAGEIGFLFIDSLTKVWYNYVDHYRKDNRIKFMTLQDWGKLLPAWQAEFSDKFVTCEGSIVFTGRGGNTYEREEDEKNEDGTIKKKGQFIKSGVKMKMAAETPFEPDLNIWMEQEQNGELEVWREAHIVKSRLDSLDGKIFRNPTYKDFKPLVDFLMGLEIGDVAGVSSSASLAPSENYEGFRKREAREIEMEKIDGLFEKFGFGTSKEDKRIKALVIEKIFGTLSKTEIEKFDPVKLTACREELEKFFDTWKATAEDKRVALAEVYQPFQSLV